MVVYLIENKINGKKYVGITKKTIETRYKEHINNYQKEVNSNVALYKAFKKYGTENFQISEIDTATSFEELKQKEISWIEKLNTFGNTGYNMTKGGDGTVNRIYSDETKEKIKNGLKEFYKNPENREKARIKTLEYFKNNPQAKEAARQKQLGRKYSEETKLKLSKVKKGVKKNWTSEGLHKIGKAASLRNKGVLCPDHVKEINRKTFLENNPMKDPEKRKLVSLSKIGRKRIYREDGSYYMSKVEENNEKF